MSKQNIAIGIDLGTTNTRAAWYNDGKVHIIPNELGKSTTPSVISFTSTECLVGEVALKQLSNLANTVFDAKRLIGRPYNDPFVQEDLKHWPFIVINDDNKPKIEVEFKNEKQTLLPQQISARILARVKRNAETFLGQEVRDVVITVPAIFNQNQREATMDAGRIAGFNVLRVLSEPTAAAVAYGIDPQQCQDKPIHVLVYDLGSNTFDVSIIKVKHGVFDVLATVGYTHFGGCDFDEILAQFLAKEFKRKNKIDVSNDKKAMRKLRLKCEEAKRDLSSAENASIFLDGFYGGNDASFTISRDRFEDLCEGHFRRTIKLVEKALEDAKLRKDEIDHVVLVSGSTRIPRIHQMLCEFFERDHLNCSMNPDEAVAIGAAIQASMLTDGTAKDLQRIPDATPPSLGVASATGENQVDVTVEIDADRILKTSAVFRKTNETNSITINNYYHLAKDEIDLMAQEAQKHKQQNNQAKGEDILMFERCVLHKWRDTRDARLGESQRQQIEVKIDEALDWIDNNGRAGRGAIEAQMATFRDFVNEYLEQPTAVTERFLDRTTGVTERPDNWTQIVYLKS